MSTCTQLTRIARIAAVLLLALASGGRAQESDNAAELAKSLSNPVADLVSIPFQFNWDNGVGPDDGLRYTLNVQPVVPFSIGENWNLIGRWIMPYVSQPSLGTGLDPTSGYSDIVFSSFFSPKKSSITWGVGPVFLLPTTSDPLLGAGQWGVGPTAVVLRQQGPWTYGVLANHIWSFAEAGNLERNDVNSTFLQPFLAYGKSGTTLTLFSESTANWEADSGEVWTIPILVLVSKVTRLGPFPFNVTAGGGPYVESPTGGPEWKLRTAFTLILPAKKS